MAGGDATPSDVPDVLAPDLRIVFVGINPGRVSAEARAHFANPRNDFWRLLHAAQLTSRLYTPQEQFFLLEEGIGVTNAAYRTTPGSSDLLRGDFAGSAERLERIVRELRPRWLAFVGKEAYRGAFGTRPELGLQREMLGETKLFVLPSTSPANAAVPWDERLRWFRELAGRESGLPERTTIRAAVVDERGRAISRRGSAPPAIRDRRPPVTAERLRPQPHPRRRLPPLVLRPVDERDRARDDVRVEAVRAQLVQRAVLLHVGLEHAVQLRVRRQRVLVELPLPQFRARRPFDRRLRDELASRLLVQVAREPKNVRLEHVLEEREPAGHVTVERRVADRQLRLVAARDEQPAELVRERHRERPPDPRLEVLLRDVRLAPGEGIGEHAGVGLDHGLDRQLAKAAAEVLGEPARVGPRLLRGIAGRHRDAMNALGPERLDRECGRDGGVDPARDADDDGLEPVLRDVVAQP